MKNLLCYGDSNTYGIIPGTCDRFSKEKRWTGLLEKKLGLNFNLIEEGLCGRTSVWYDPIEDIMSGSDYLIPCLKSHGPLDILILMLGTNDTKNRFGASPEDISSGIGRLVDISLTVNPNLKILVISPASIRKVGFTHLDDMFIGGVEKSKKLSNKLEEMTKEKKVEFLNANLYTKTGDGDGVHLDENGQIALANAIYDKLNNLYWL